MPGQIPVGIREILVEDFRGIRSESLKFLDAQGSVSDVIVLAGPNGSGKTSILEACLLALGHPELIRNSSGAPLVHAGSHSYRITAKLHLNGENTEVTMKGIDTFQRSARPSRDALPCLYFSSSRAPKLVGPVPVTAGRRGKRPFDTEDNRLWLIKQFLVNAKAHAIMTGSGQMDGMSVFETSLQRLNDMWRLFHPGREQTFTVEPVGDDPEAGFDVLLLGPDRVRLPLDSLSSGQLELFAFFGAFLRAKFQEGVVIIDEPELHLDHQWHTLTLQAFRRFLPRVQFLVATHSPDVFDSVYSFQRHLLLPPGDPRNVSWTARPSGVA